MSTPSRCSTSARRELARRSARCPRGRRCRRPAAATDRPGGQPAISRSVSGSCALNALSRRLCLEAEVEPGQHDAAEDDQRAGGSSCRRRAAGRAAPCRRRCRRAAAATPRASATMPAASSACAIFVLEVACCGAARWPPSPSPAPVRSSVGRAASASFARGPRLPVSAVDVDLVLGRGCARCLAADQRDQRPSRPRPSARTPAPASIGAVSDRARLSGVGRRSGPCQLGRRRLANAMAYVGVGLRRPRRASMETVDVGVGFDAGRAASKVTSSWWARASASAGEDRRRAPPGPPAMTRAVVGRRRCCASGVEAWCLLVEGDDVDRRASASLIAGGDDLGVGVAAGVGAVREHEQVARAGRCRRLRRASMMPSYSARAPGSASRPSMAARSASRSVGRARARSSTLPANVTMPT